MKSAATTQELVPEAAPGRVGTRLSEQGSLPALTLAMAADHVREGIRVNAVTPGKADTPWVDRLVSAAPDADSALRQLRERQPRSALLGCKVEWGVSQLSA
jgi:hypothetical protein